MKKAIVTGATSFIGAHLIKKLVEEGWKVYAVVRKKNTKEKLLPDSKQIVIIRLNMEEYGRLEEKIKEPCDVYVSLAWDGTRGKERLDAKKQEENYKYSMEALKAVKNIGCKLVISAGSQAEYGLMQNKINEDAVCRPNTEYGIWKLNYYKDGMDYAKQHDMAFKEPRFFSLYGEDDDERTMILSILTNMIKNMPCKMTQCVQLWDFLYIDDAIDGIIRLINIPCEDGVYNFGSGDIRPLKEFVMEMYQIADSKSQLLFGAISYPDTGMVNVCPDISKLQTQTGWKAATSFADGIQKIINYRW
jgi:nucleoside-diphosphate-sugar epimerase